MITKETEKNKKLYGNLYAEASDALRAADGSSEGSDIQNITTLNEYFVSLPELIKLMGTPSFKSKFVILPIDEDLFEINANTREIIVPPSFRKSAGVAGDQVAEVIYFSIDRYFDTMDLYNQNIHIEWTTPDGVDGVSEELIRDIESQPGKIIFGWALHDKITEMPGTIEFAIRFWTTKKNDANEDIVEYTLRTLPQKITISKGLDIANLNDNGRPDALSKAAQEFIFNRIVKSVQDNVVATPAALPELATLYCTYTDNEETKTIEFDVDKVNEQGSFTLVENIDGKYTVYMGVKYKDNGYVSYFVDEKQDKDLTYEKTRDKKYNEHKRYYKSNGDEYSIIDFESMESPEQKNTTFEQYKNDDNIYERLAIFEFIPRLLEGESYSPENPVIEGYTTNEPILLELKNKLGTLSNVKTKEIGIYKPGPVDPTLNWGNIDLVRKVFDKDKEQSITIELSDDEIKNLNVGTESYEKTKYQWFMDDREITGVEDTSTSYTIDPDDFSGDMHIYKIKPINYLNGVSEPGKKEKKFRVTTFPKDFDENDTIEITQDVEYGPEITISINTKEGKLTDGFEYEVWYVSALKDQFDDSFKEIGEILSDSTYIAENSGSYVFKIKNIVNDERSENAFQTNIIKVFIQNQ